MAEPATLAPDRPETDPKEADTDLPDPSAESRQAAADAPAEPAPRASSRRPKGTPIVIHGANATGMAVGGAYAAFGAAGAVAAGATGVAAVGAALYRNRKKNSPAAEARRAAREAAKAARAAYRSGGLGGGRGTGPGSPWGRGNHRTGTGSGAGGGRAPLGANRPSSGTGLGGGPGKGATGSGTGTSAKDNGKHAGMMRRAARWAKNKLLGSGNGASAGSAGNGASAGSASKGSSNTKAPRGWAGRAWQTLKGAAGRVRRWLGMTGSRSGTNGKSKHSAAGPGGRLYRLRRSLLRKLRHYARCTGAGVFAALVGLLCVVPGTAWALWRLITRHPDPAHAWEWPIRVAGRVWRHWLKHSRRLREQDLKADQLKMTVNDPQEGEPLMSNSLVLSPIQLDGRNSRFAQAMAQTLSAYTRYQPRSMMEVAAEYAGLPNGLRAAAASIQYLCINSANWPCSQRAIVKLTEAYEKLKAASTGAEHMVTTFREVHAFDIERIVTPRTNEWMWNVTPLGPDVPEGAMFAPGKIETGCVLTAALYKQLGITHMLQVGSEYEGIGLGLADLAEAITVLYQRSRDLYPVEDSVTTVIANVAMVVRAASDDAAISAKLFLEDHAREISHNKNPRKGPAAENMWSAPR